jgi:hypothetical protein
MSKIVCPYCFDKFERSDVEFRCSNIGRCKKENDPILAKFWGDSMQVTGLPVRAYRGLRTALGLAPDSAVCSACHERTYLTICPRCHNRIPKEMVKNKGYIISIIGARSSGKTNYITTLINELMRHGCHLGDIGLTAVNVTDDPQYNTQQRYERDFFDILYRKKKCPPQTDINAKESRIPLIYELSNPKKQSIYLVFYDTAGENFANIKNIAGNVKFLNESDAVIFLLDTFEVPYVHSKLGLKGDINLRYNIIVDNVLSHFKEGDPKIRDAHFKKPMALVFSKIDAILSNEEKFEDTSIAGMSIANNSNFLDGSPVSLADFDSISASLQGALSVWDENNFINNIRNNYKNAKFFGISALGGQPDASNNISLIKPYRVLDPLVWILHEFGYSLPIKK